MADQHNEVQAIREAIRKFIAEVVPAIIEKKQAAQCQDDSSNPEQPSAQ